MKEGPSSPPAPPGAAEGDAGGDEGAVEDTADALNSQRRLMTRRLMTNGHDRPEGDDCTICFLPIEYPLGRHSAVNWCCSKRVCNGCLLAAGIRGLYVNCPFCRTPVAAEDSSSDLAKIQDRVRRGDPQATKELGDGYYQGSRGLTKDFPRAIELWTQQSVGHWMHTTNLATFTTVAFVSKKTSQGAFITGSTPR